MKVCERLELLVAAAQKRGDVLEHILLSGPPGLGKTTLANIIAHEMDVNIKNTSGPVIEKAGELAGNTSADVHFQLAKVYTDQRKYALAADALEMFLKYRPDAQNVSEIKEMVASLRKKT